jgi:hypothetical protein
MPPRSAEGRTDYPRGEGHELIADHVTLGPQRLLQKTTLLQISYQAMCGRKRKRQRLRDLRDRHRLGLIGDIANDRERTVERGVFAGFTQCLAPPYDWQKLSFSGIISIEIRKYDSVLFAPAPIVGFGRSESRVCPGSIG